MTKDLYLETPSDASAQRLVEWVVRTGEELHG